MSLILQPQKVFTVVRQIANHTDAATYYVRAVIRNAYTDEILQTLNLTDKGSQRFKGDWQVVADPSGEGLYVSIVTSVYEDSGYTTKSGNYGDEENTYRVFDQLVNRAGGATMGGIGASSGVDARTVRRIIQEELAKVPKPEPVDLTQIPAPKEYTMRWDEVLSDLEAVKKAIGAIEMPVTDLAPVLARLGDVERAIADKAVTPETDLKPILDKLSTEREMTEVEAREVRDIMDAFRDAMPEIVEKAVDSVLKRTKFKSEVTMAVDDEADAGEPTPRRPRKRPPIDLTKLTA